MFIRLAAPGKLVAPSWRLAANGVGLIAYFIQIVHYAQWLCHCCVLYPGYVPPRCPKKGCMAQFFCPEMASEALVPGDLIENFPGMGGGGGGGIPPDPP